MTRLCQSHPHLPLIRTLKKFIFIEDEEDESGMLIKQAKGLFECMKKKATDYVDNELPIHPHSENEEPSYSL